jgi:Fe-S-cluster-containing hydrogenase component 2
MDKTGLKITGTPSMAELRAAGGYPTQGEFLRGPVVVIECTQEIPCNPCEAACPKHAICIGDSITNRPCIDRTKCIACGLCISACPGLAIYIKDYTYSETRASITFPFEYYPLPAKGDEIELVNRFGEAVCRGEVLKIANGPANDKTAIVTAAFAKDCFDEVVSMRTARGD